MRPVRQQDDVFAFVWHRDAAGYRFVPRSDAKARSTAPKASDVLLGQSAGEIMRKRGALEPVHPGVVPHLHRLFAKLPDDPEAICDFCAQFGFLGVAGETDARLIESEPIQEIRIQRDHMRDVIATVDEFFRLERHLKKAAQEHEEETGEPAARDPSEFRQILGGLFNQWVSPRMTVRLTPVTSARGQAGVALKVVPRTLLSFLWLQVAEEIQGNARWRLCEWCGGPIPQGAREDKVTCSDRCRKALSVDNQKQEPPRSSSKRGTRARRTRTKRKSQ